MPSYRLTRAAADDIASIFRTSVELFGPSQADAYHAGIERRFEFLAGTPRAARVRHEIDPPVRAYSYKAHLIVYEIDDDDIVVILRVRHGREDWLNSGDA